jgi:hypothetical protein
MSGMFDRLKATLEHELGAVLPKGTALPGGAAEEIVRKCLIAMREPTKGMYTAGFRASPHDRETRSQIASSDSWTRLGVIGPYQAMIDDVLEGAEAVRSSRREAEKAAA